MKPDEYRTEHPDEYKKLVVQVTEDALAPLQAELAERDKEIATLKERNESLSQSLEETGGRLLKLEKTDAIRTEKEMGREAAEIWSRELVDSSVPVRLHEKAQSHVSHGKFIKDGVFDREAFAEAVKEEIKDWEDKTATVIGGGTPPGTEQVTEAETVKKEDEESVKEMLEMAEGEESSTQH